METILITGGSGVLGRELVARMAGPNRSIRVLSRRHDLTLPRGARLLRGDLSSGQGVDEAVEGVDVIVHCATSPYKKTWETDVEGTRRLIGAASQAPPRHVIYVSIVGIDRIPLRYYKAKLAAEALVRESGLPWTILRATQFHDLVLKSMQDLTWSPLFPVPKGFSFQPIAAGDVADRLVALARDKASGRVSEIGGPEVRDTTDLARAYLERVGMKRAVVPVPIPGRVAQAFRSGANLSPHHPEGKLTWDEFLQSRRTRKEGRRSR